MSGGGERESQGQRSEEREPPFHDVKKVSTTRAFPLPPARGSATLAPGSPRGMKIVPAVLVLFFAAPGAALAAPTSLLARDLPARNGVTARAPERFQLVGLHWRGNGAVRFRTRSVD